METKQLSKPQTPPVQEFSHHVSVPTGEGVRVDKVITIQRPVSEVYSYWRRLENLPRFMRHVKSVTERDALHSHWAVTTLGEKVLEWDAEIIEQRENEMLSWRSAPGAEVDNAGSVWFTPVPGGSGTVVRLSLMYAPPGGKAGEMLAKVFGRDADSEIEEDLRRLQSLLETGQLPEEQTPPQWRRRALETARDAAQKADSYLRDNPWTFIFSVAAVGLVVGFLLGRPGARPAHRYEGA